MIRRHILGALHVGVTKEEISEIIAQMIFYGGMPAAVNAFRVAKETFDEVDPADPNDTISAADAEFLARYEAAAQRTADQASQETLESL